MNQKIKIFSLFLALIFLFSPCAVLPLQASFVPVLCAAAEDNDNEDSPPRLYAQSAVLMDAASGRVLYEKDGKKALPMASTTKIMTCILALEYGQPEEYASVSAYAASMPKVKLNVSPNEYYKVKDLLYSLMLESHNDAAVVIAEHIAGSVEAFAEMMNQKARDIGCFDTFFITPNGLDATVTLADGTVKTHSTTATDLARILSYCITDSPKKEEFLEITRAPSYSFVNYKEKDGDFSPGGRSFQCNNHNAFLSMMEGALSGKTGFTGNAGYCYVGSLQRDNKTLVVALLACGWPNNKTYKWSDTKALMNYGLNNFEYHTLSEAAVDESLLKPVAVINGQTDHIGGVAYAAIKIDRQQTPGSAGRPNIKEDSSASADDESSVLLKKGERIEADLQIVSQLTAPVSSGTQVGMVKYLAGGELYRIEPIVALNDIPAIDFSWCLKQVLQKYSL